MNRAALLEIWLREEAQPFQGWDFSYLHGRLFEDDPPWSYEQRVTGLLQSATSVIDLSTGGGERFAALRPHLPARTVATEEYPPNARLAHDRLAPLGIPVVMAASNELVTLPFAPAAFDLVLNRHGAFRSSEVARILTAGGTFLTKQVHGLWAYDLLAVFGATPQWPEATAEKYLPLLAAAGLTIISVLEWNGKIRFSDVGAIVYYLKAIPWLVPDFRVSTHQAELFRLQDQLEAGDELTFFAGTYMIEART